jgi:F0F1-type ATP synthase membrane subunit c/vacuolar-type H+-ATPase subunit K
LSLRAGFAVLRVVFGAALMIGTIIYAIWYAVALYRNPADLLPQMLIGLGIAVVWLAYVLIL